MTMEKQRKLQDNLHCKGVIDDKGNPLAPHIGKEVSVARGEVELIIRVAVQLVIPIFLVVMIHVLFT